MLNKIINKPISKIAILGMLIGSSLSLTNKITDYTINKFKEVIPKKIETISLNYGMPMGRVYYWDNKADIYLGYGKSFVDKNGDGNLDYRINHGKITLPMDMSISERREFNYWQKKYNNLNEN